jgi:hypothetical protein
VIGDWRGVIRWLAAGAVVVNDEFGQGFAFGFCG